MTDAETQRDTNVPPEADTQTPAPKKNRNWRIYLDRRIISLTLLGIVSGLPWSLTHTTLNYWLSTEGVSMKLVGLFALVSLPYSFKFVWAPLIDLYSSPTFSSFGHRQGWMIWAQLGLTLCLGGVASLNPKDTLTLLAILSLLTSFFAASQDIAVDAWRVEVLEDDEQGIGATVATFGYRLGMYVSSAGALLLSAFFSWSTVYYAMAGVALLGVVVTFSTRSIQRQAGSSVPAQLRPGWITLSASLLLLTPLLCLLGALFNQDPSNPMEFLGMSSELWRLVEGGLTASKGLFKVIGGGLIILIIIRLFTSDARHQARAQLGVDWPAILLFISLFRLGDHLLNFFLYPSLNDLGFTALEIAGVAKTWGLIATFIGTFLGGWLVYRVGLMKVMVIAGVAQLLSNLTLSAQSLLGHHLPFLYVSIGVQDIALGMVNATFVAYISSLCDRKYAATQFAFLSALSSMLKTFLQAGSGWLVEACHEQFGLQSGWALYFALTSLAAVPGMILLLWLNRRAVARGQSSMASQ